MGWPPTLGTLLRLQWLFAALAVGFLTASAARQALQGAPLSAANIPASIALFALYGGSLLLPRAGRLGWYRVAMVLAILFFGGGGVIGNVVRYLQTGLEFYSSVGAWLVAVAINAFGTGLNIIAAGGRFKADAMPDT